MSKFYCLDIEFHDVDFSPYYIKGKTEIDKVHHTHLHTRQDEIELRIFYEDSSYFGEKLVKYTIERANARMDSFRSLLNRFDTTTESWKGFNYLSFIVLVFKKFKPKKV